MRSRPRREFQRVVTSIHQSVAGTLARKVGDPRVGFVTVTAVEVAPDLSVATVWVSVMGSDEEKQTALQGLESAKGLVRSQLAQTVRMRTVPSLRFKLDQGLERAARIDRLIHETKHSESDT